MNWITEEKIGLLEKDMQALITELRKASQTEDETTFDFIQVIRSADAKCNGLHTTIAGWQVLLGAILGRR